MSYTINVGGKIIISAKGGIKTFAKEDIVLNAGKTISLKGEENGVSFGEPEDAPMPDIKKIIKKNIYIIIPKETESYVIDKSLEHNGWKVIVAPDLEIANSIMTNYLSGKSANNTIIEAHGGVMKYPDGISSGMRFSSETKKITGVELCEYSKGKNTTIDKKYIDALIAITKRTKNLLLMSCEVNFDNTNSFGLNLSDLAPNTTIFLTGDIVDIPSCDTNSPKRTRRWTVCDKHKNCGLSDINLTDNPYFGWKKYKSGALIGSYQNIKLSINGTPLTIPWKK